MKIRTINTKVEAQASQFNVNSMNEIIVNYNDGGQDSDYAHNYEAFIEKLGRWMPLTEAFKKQHVIPNNTNTFFAEPRNGEDRARGYFL